MREIKFRAMVLASVTGKRKNTFVYGSYVKTFHASEGAVIIPNDGFGHREVRKGTEGQFTGLTDDNGVDIYEGDILSVDNESHSIKGQKELVRFSLYDDNEQYETYQHLGWNIADLPLVDCVKDGSIVIGNIHQSPELLEQ